jgi:hypothetical protein
MGSRTTAAWDLVLPCHFLYCMGSCTTAAWDLVLPCRFSYSYCMGSSTTAAWDLVLPCRFSYSYCMGSRTTVAWDLVLPCHFLYCMGSRTTAAWDLVLPCRFSYSYCMGSRTTAAWDLVLPCHFLHCMGSRSTVSFLVLYGILYYRVGSRTTVSFLVLCGISYRVESRSKPNGQRSMAHSNARWCTQPALLTYHYCAMYDCLIRYGLALECAIERCTVRWMIVSDTRCILTRPHCILTRPLLGKVLHPHSVRQIASLIKSNSSHFYSLTLYVAAVVPRPMVLGPCCKLHREKGHC